MGTSKFKKKLAKEKYIKGVRTKNKPISKGLDGIYIVK